MLGRKSSASSAAAAVTVALALALTGCGSSSDGASSPPTSPADATETTASTTTDPSAADGSAVAVSGFRFQPDDLEVLVGDEVTWTNEDEVTHTATAADGSFDVTMEGADTSGAHTFTEPGTYEYRCAVHESMNGAIVVTDGEAGATGP